MFRGALRQWEGREDGWSGGWRKGVEEEGGMAGGEGGGLRVLQGWPYTTQLSPRGGSLEGNISVLVSGAAFWDYGT